jgi:hypothetical protein
MGILELSICIIAALILGTIISLTHKKTSTYTKNFLITIALLPLFVFMIILMVNGNLGTSVAILGAFSLVRFRSLPGTSKEILTVFFSMTVGLALGMGSVALASLITVVGSIAMFALDKMELFSEDKNEKVLDITIPENLDYGSLFDDEFKTYVKDYKLESVKTTNMGSLFNLKYRISLKNDRKEKEFIDALRVKNGNLKIALTHSINETEL